MPPIDDPETLKLVLEAAGIENVQEVTKSFDELKDAGKNLAPPLDQAKEVLTQTTPVLDELKNATTLLAQAQKDLNAELLAGTIQADTYLERSRELDRAQGEVAETLERLAGTGESGGFAGLTSNVFKAERAFTALATGHGLGRVGPMLESIIGAAGGAAGIGYGIAGLAFLLETIVPKVVHFLSSWDSDKLDAANKSVDDLIAKIQKLQALKGDEASKAFRDYLPGQDILGMTAGALGTSGLGEQATEEEKASMEGRIAPIQGMDAAGYRALQEEAKQKVAARIQKANVAQAAKWIDQAQEPGEAGKRARAMLKGLAQQAPGAFPPEFSGFLEGLEETPEQAKAAEQEIEENDPDQQYMTRHKANREAYNATVDPWNQRVKAEEQGRKDIERITDQARTSGQHNEAHFAADRKRNAAIAQRDATRQERDNTPEAINRRELAAQQNAVMGQVQAENQANIAQGGQGATPDFMRQVTGQAMRNVNLGADIATAVNMAIEQVQQKIAADFTRGMQQQYRSQQLMGGSY